MMRCPRVLPRDAPRGNTRTDRLELLLEAKRVLVHGGLLVERLLHGRREALVLRLGRRRSVQDLVH